MDTSTAVITNPQLLFEKTAHPVISNISAAEHNIYGTGQGNVNKEPGEWITFDLHTRLMHMMALANSTMYIRYRVTSTVSDRFDETNAPLRSWFVPQPTTASFIRSWNVRYNGEQIEHIDHYPIVVHTDMWSNSPHEGQNSLTYYDAVDTDYVVRKLWAIKATATDKTNWIVSEVPMYSLLTEIEAIPIYKMHGTNSIELQLANFSAVFDYVKSGDQGTYCYEDWNEYSYEVSDMWIHTIGVKGEHGSQLDNTRFDSGSILGVTVRQKQTTGTAIEEIRFPVSASSLHAVRTVMVHPKYQSPANNESGGSLWTRSGFIGSYYEDTTLKSALNPPLITYYDWSIGGLKYPRTGVGYEIDVNDMERIDASMANQARAFEGRRHASTQITLFKNAPYDYSGVRLWQGRRGFSRPVEGAFIPSYLGGVGDFVLPSHDVATGKWNNSETFPQTRIMNCHPSKFQMFGMFGPAPEKPLVVQGTKIEKQVVSLNLIRQNAFPTTAVTRVWPKDSGTGNDLLTIKETPPLAVSVFYFNAQLIVADGNLTVWT